MLEVSRKTRSRDRVVSIFYVAGVGKNATNEAGANRPTKSGQRRKGVDYFLLERHAQIKYKRAYYFFKFDES